MPALKSETNAPRFELPLLGGGRFSLKDALRKSPVLLAFFKVSCPVCQYAFPLYERLARAVEQSGTQLVGISQNNEAETLKFAKEYGVTFPLALDDTRSYPVSNAYGLTNVPTLFEISQEGLIALTCVGWEKAAVEDVYLRYATRESNHRTPLFGHSERVADFRAG